MSFDIRQLRYAIAAADHRSFHRAAVARDIEQSTLSRNILKLERVVGVKLFKRSRAGASPTVAGAEFIRTARHIVAKADQLVTAMRAAGQGRAGGLVVGYKHPISAGHLRATLVAWRETHPDVEVERVEDERESLIAALDAGVVDLAILSGEARYAGMRRATLWSERLLAALPAAHPLAEREHVELTDLRDETILLTAESPGPDTRDLILAHFAAAGISPTIRTQHVSPDSLLSLLGAGGGITLICECASGARYPDVVLREVHDLHGQKWIGYSGYWRKENENPVLRRFLAFVRSRYALSFDID